MLGLNSGVRAIAAGGYHTCALTDGDGVKCWGANASGQLGDGTTVQRVTPVDVIGLTCGVSAIGAGGCHTCALTASGGIQCWGDNGYGQLGDGTTTLRTTPVAVIGLSIAVDAVAAGMRHTCAVIHEDRLTCWGRNEYGQLGDGSTEDRSTPVHVAGFGSGSRYLPMILHQ